MTRRMLVALSLAGTALVTVAALLVLFAHDFQPFGPAEKLAQVGTNAVWIFAGLVAWTRRPGNRVGALMVAVGVTDLLQQLYWDAALPFTVAQVLAFASTPVTAQLFMAFPSGRLTGRAERWYVASAYLLVLVLSPINALFWDWQRTECPTCPPNLLLVTSDPQFWEPWSIAGDVILVGLLGTGVALLVRRLRRATVATRRAFAPVLVTASLASLGLCVVLAMDAAGMKTEGSVALWIADVLYAAVPLAFLVGLLRMRWRRAVVADLVLELGSASGPTNARDAIARALRDPSLEVAYWLPEGERFVDSAGQPVAVEETPSRAVSLLEHDSERVAALLHDPSLRDDARLLDAVCAAATLALENVRLQADLRAQLAEVRASRARIVAAGDAERRRLERDLHDGAQQRLLGIRLALQLARSRVPGDALEGTESLLADADAEVVAALAELRSLARGIHPAILTEEGLAPALEALARRAPLPVALHACGERLPPAVEATSYFVAAEALANCVKHAHARNATINVARRNGRVVIDIVDDGCGGADPRGHGLNGLRDRVESQDGSLVVESSPGVGTLVRAEIPCA